MPSTDGRLDAQHPQAVERRRQPRQRLLRDVVGVGVEVDDRRDSGQEPVHAAPRDRALHGRVLVGGGRVVGRDHRAQRLGRERLAARRGGRRRAACGSAPPVAAAGLRAAHRAAAAAEARCASSAFAGMFPTVPPPTS